MAYAIVCASGPYYKIHAALKDALTVRIGYRRRMNDVS